MIREDASQVREQAVEGTESLSDIRKDILAFRKAFEEQLQQRKQLSDLAPDIDIQAIYDESDRAVSEKFAESVRLRTEKWREKSKIRAQDNFQVWKDIDDKVEQINTAEVTDSTLDSLPVSEFPQTALELPRAESLRPEEETGGEGTESKPLNLSPMEQKRQNSIDEKVLELQRLSTNSGTFQEYAIHPLFVKLMPHFLRDPQRKEAERWLEESLKELKKPDELQNLRDNIADFWKRAQTIYTLASFRGTKEVQDYYEVLDINREADISAIKENYRVLTRTFHPDMIGSYALPGSPEAQQSHDILVLINEAYSTLSDSIKKNSYDQSIFDAPRRKRAESSSSEKADSNPFSSKQEERSGSRQEGYDSPPSPEVQNLLRQLENADTLQRMKELLTQLSSKGWVFRGGENQQQVAYSARNVLYTVKEVERAIAVAVENYKDRSYVQPLLESIPLMFNMRRNAESGMLSIYFGLKDLRNDEATLAEMIMALQRLDSVKFVIKASKNGMPKNIYPEQLVSVMQAVFHNPSPRTLSDSLAELSSIFDIRSKVIHSVQQEFSIIDRMRFSIPTEYRSQYENYLQKIKKK